MVPDFCAPIMMKSGRDPVLQVACRYSQTNLRKSASSVLSEKFLLLTLIDGSLSSFDLV